jgi:hypothetical protein
MFSFFCVLFGAFECFVACVVKTWFFWNGDVMTNDIVSTGPGFMMTKTKTLLSAIAAHPHLTVRELSPHCGGMGRATMANVLWNMEQDGWVVKSGRRRCGVTNRPAFTWAAVAKA